MARLVALTLLATLARLPLLALLPLLTVLGLAVLLALLADPLLERLHAAHQVARGLERFGPLVGRILTDRRLRVGQGLADDLDVGADLLLERDRVLRRAAEDDAARVADLLLELVAANRVGRLLQPARRFALVTAEVGRGVVELSLEVGHLGGHLVLALHQAADLRAALLRVLAELAHILGDLTLGVGQRLDAVQRVGNIALQPPRLLPLQPPLRLAQLVERGARLGHGVAVGVRRGAPHGVGRLLQLPRRLHQVGIGFLARQALELTGRFLGFIGQRPLARAAA